MKKSDKKENPHAGHRERLRKRFLEEGGDSFDKHQLLELLLFSAIPMQDTNVFAHRLLDNFNNSFNVLANSDHREIMEKCGVSINVAIFLKAMGQFAKECQKEIIENKTVLGTIEQSGEYAVNILMYEKRERFYMFCMDAGSHLIKAVRVAKGSQLRVQVEAADVAREALLCEAVFVIFAHNHPGGSLEPSKSDINLTKKLKEVLAPLSINVVDHIIVANGKYYSFVEHDLM